MPINFTQIFTDSLNFMRNKQSITMKFTTYFFIVAMIINFLISNLSSTGLQLSDLSNSNAIENTSTPLLTDIVYLGFVQVLANLFISAWGISTIDQLSKQINTSFKNTILLTLKRFIGFFFMSAIITLPLMIGSAEIIVSYFTQKPLSPFSIFTMALGLFVFIRLNIAPIHYLVNQTTLNSTIQNIWKMGIKRNYPLFVYFVINDMLLRLLSYQILNLGKNSFILEIISIFIVSLISVFSLVFVYRFYSIFMQKA